MNVLFLFESILPSNYHKHTISPGELRIIASQPQVNNVIALGRAGKSFYDVRNQTQQKTFLEKKITIKHIYGFSHPIWYYISGMILFIKAIPIIRKHKIDLIHAESPHISGPFAVILGKMYSIPVAIEYRATYDEILYNRFQCIPTKIKKIGFDIVINFSFKNCNLILANSQTYAKQLKQSFSAEKIFNYNPGVNPPQNIKKINQKQITLGFIGRHYPDKGLMFFLKAVKKMNSPQIKILIAGEGPVTQTAKQYSKKHNLSNVNFLGTQDRWKFFNQIDILVNPNIIMNALEMVNVEAASQKIPTICFGDNTYPETVIHNQTGIKVPNKDTKALAKAIIKLASHPQRTQKLGNQAFNHYFSYYTIEKQIHNLKKAYCTLFPN